MKNQSSFRNYSVLILMLGLTLSACQKAGQSNSLPGSPVSPSNPGSPASPSDPTNPKSPNASSTPEMDGTGDVGGGNGLNGRVLESYRVDVTELEAFKKVLKPKFDAMDENDRKSGKKTTADSSTKNLNFKTWYVAPLKFKIIKNEVLGLSFTEDRTEQLAAQTQREIWINKEIFDKMDIQHQAELIAHELFMSYYTFKFESGANICKLLTFEPGFDCDKITGPLAQAPEPARNLNDQDYAQIRAFTSWFLAQGSSLTGELLQARLHRSGFDKRFASSEKTSGPAFEKSADRILTDKEILNRAQQGLQKGLFQSTCTSTLDNMPESFQCQLVFDFLNPAKNDKGEVIKDSLSWSLLGFKNITGFASLGQTMGSSTMSSASQHVELKDLTGDYMMGLAGVFKANDRYYQINIISKKTTPHPTVLKVDVIAILIVERVSHGLIKYNYKGYEHTCPSYSTTLNAEGKKNYILLKAKTEYDDSQLIPFEDWIYDMNCDQAYLLDGEK